MWVELLAKDRKSSHRPSQSTETPDETKKRRHTLAFFFSFSEILLLFTDLRIFIDESLVLRVSRYDLSITRSLTIESSESFEFSDLRK